MIDTIIVITYLYIEMINFENLDKENRLIAEKISQKFRCERGERGAVKNHDFRVITFDRLFSFLAKDEKKLIDAVLLINPKNYGIKARFLGVEPVPKNLVSIKGQRYIIKKEIKIMEFTHFLPKNNFLAFRELNKKMKSDINREINVYSGYRSPAFQVMLFISKFVGNDFDLKKTLRLACLPAYSEHCSVKIQGIDVAPCRGIADLKNFYKTKEYGWLTHNARQFDFFLSYPKNNKIGMAFEPWHWHFRN